MDSKHSEGEQIRVTKEMIEAGLRAWKTWDEKGWSLESLVATIFREMAKAERRSRGRRLRR